MFLNLQADNRTALLSEWPNPGNFDGSSKGIVYLLAQLMRRRGIDIGWDANGPISGKSPLLYLPTLIAALLSAKPEFETNFETAAGSFYSPPRCEIGWCCIRNLLEAVGTDLNILHAFGERPHNPRPIMEARLHKAISSEWSPSLSETGIRGYRLTLLLAEELKCWVEELTSMAWDEICECQNSFSIMQQGRLDYRTNLTTEITMEQAALKRHFCSQHDLEDITMLAACQLKQRATYWRMEERQFLSNLATPQSGCYLQNNGENTF